jgi:hypothetical protein
MNCEEDQAAVGCAATWGLHGQHEGEGLLTKLSCWWKWHVLRPSNATEGNMLR